MTAVPEYRLSVDHGRDGMEVYRMNMEVKKDVPPQKQMTIALDNYLALSSVLQADMSALLDCETGTQHWRRNFIRVSARSSELWPKVGDGVMR
jgi:hypothetical protein